MSQNETLQERITRLQNELDEINQSEEFTPELIDKRNLLANQLAEAEDELKKQGGTNEEISEQAESLPADAITIDGETYLLRMFAKDEKNARALVSLVSVKLKSQEKILLAQIEEIKAEHAAEVTDQQELIRSLKEQLAQAIMDKEDMEAKRDAAAREIESLKAELSGKELLVSEKQEQIDKLRTEIAMGASAAAKDITADVEDFKRQLRELEDAKPAITDVQKLDFSGKKYRVQLVETGEYIEITGMEKFGYREVTAEEAERFRAERASQPVVPAVKPVQEGDSDHPALDVTEEAGGIEAFQPFGPPEVGQIAIDAMAEGPSDVVRPPYVTWEAFEEVNRRLDRLEGTRKEDAA